MRKTLLKGNMVYHGQHRLRIGLGATLQVRDVARCSSFEAGCHEVTIQLVDGAWIANGHINKWRFVVACQCIVNALGRRSEVGVGVIFLKNIQIERLAALWFG